MTDKVQKIREWVKARLDENNSKQSLPQFYGMMEEDARFLDFLDTMEEELVSEDFEEALANEWKGYIDRGAATVDALEDNTQELTFAKGFYRGAKWKEQMMTKATVDSVKSADKRN